jgi:hypothetical protein
MQLLQVCCKYTNWYLQIEIKIVLLFPNGEGVGGGGRGREGNEGIERVHRIHTKVLTVVKAGTFTCLITDGEYKALQS